MKISTAFLCLSCQEHISYQPRLSCHLAENERIAPINNFRHVVDDPCGFCQQTQQLPIYPVLSSRFQSFEFTGLKERRKTTEMATDDDNPNILKSTMPQVDGIMDDAAIQAYADELKQHPAFMDPADFDPSKPMSPAMEALQLLKYDSESAENNAESYKDDGNYNFKLKKYRWAIDNYTAGIKCKTRNKELNAILYSNRAAANIRIGNFRTALHDCMIALKFKPDHFKAVLKGVQCCMELTRYSEAKKWCDIGLEINPSDKSLLDTRNKADKLQRQQDRDRRKEQAKERKEQEAERKLIEIVKSRGVNIADIKKGQPVENTLLLSSLESKHPSGAKVHVDKDGALIWPVMFLYPEYAQTDFIEQFNENHTFDDHLRHMFSPDQPAAPWDEDHKYLSDQLEVYFEDRKQETILQVSRTATLSDTLKNPRYTVQGGTPSFIILVKGSPFAKHFLQKYGL